MKLLLYLVQLLFMVLTACSTSQSEQFADHGRSSLQGVTPDLTHQAVATIEQPHQNIENYSPTLKTRQFDDPPNLDLFRVTKQLVPGGGYTTRTVEGHDELQVGHTEIFWLIDLKETKSYRSQFTLKLITSHAYWYVEDGLDINYEGLLRSAAHFEDHIYPNVTRVFGTEWIPGVDNDPRLNVLNAQLTGVAGYFSSTDEYPVQVRPRSNESESIYINALDIAPGSDAYHLVLSHELQHAIHWNADSSEDTWINEGLSELSSSISLGSTLSIPHFLLGGPVSLTNWPTSPENSMNYYGATSLFMHFLTEHYGGRTDLRGLLAQPEDGIIGVNKYLEELGYEARFDDVFRDWAVANILDQHLNAGDDIPGYRDLEIKASISGSITGINHKQIEIPQYAIEYTELKSISRPFHLSFQGQTHTKLLPVNTGPSGCWWSNSGDSIDSILSHRVNIPAGSMASLEYEIWFDIEENWDYLYVEVSMDGGETWRIIDTPKTSSKNPIGNAFGAGYTGKSNGWLTESVDLTPFVSENLWIRFQYITDEAVNASGACLRNMSVLAAGIGPDSDGWETQGFIFTDNIVKQDFQVQLIIIGDAPQVYHLTLNADNTGAWTFNPSESDEYFIVAVGSLAEKTREFANYTLRLNPT